MCSFGNVDTHIDISINFPFSNVNLLEPVTKMFASKIELKEREDIIIFLREFLFRRHHTCGGLRNAKVQFMALYSNDGDGRIEGKVGRFRKSGCTVAQILNI